MGPVGAATIVGVVAGSAVAFVAVVAMSAVARVVFGCGYCGDILLFRQKGEEAVATR